MKSNYCSRCNRSSNKLFNCKYEEHEEDWFLLCPKCALECGQIFKKAFRNKCGQFVSIGLVKSRKERSLF